MPPSTSLFLKPLEINDMWERMKLPPHSISLFTKGFVGKWEVLCQEGRVWPMACVLRHGQLYVTEGWNSFVSEKDLHVGDVVEAYEWEDEAGLQDRKDPVVDRVPSEPPPNGNLGVATPAEFTAEENESDNILANTGEALDRVRRIFFSVFVRNRKENESDDISANLHEPLLSRNTSPVSTNLENEHDIGANRGNAQYGSGQNYRQENESGDISADTVSRDTIRGQLSLEHIEANGGNSRDGSGQDYREVPLWEWIFLVSNLILEITTAVFDQLSSPHKPLYAQVGMALSLLALVLCVVQLFYKGVKERVTFEWPTGKIPWFYSHPPGPRDTKPLGNLADLIGLVSAICQCIVTAINYANGAIKFSLLPIISAIVLLFSRILETVLK